MAMRRGNINGIVVGDYRVWGIFPGSLIAGTPLISAIFGRTLGLVWTKINPNLGLIAHFHSSHSALTTLTAAPCAPLYAPFTLTDAPIPTRYQDILRRLYVISIVVRCAANIDNLNRRMVVTIIR